MIKTSKQFPKSIQKLTFYGPQCTKLCLKCILHNNIIFKIYTKTAHWKLIWLYRITGK